jgi:hypothetical protein
MQPQSQPQPQPVTREALWTPWDGIGLEHLRLTTRPERVSADGLVVTVCAGQIYRVNYEVRCDARWRVRELRVTAQATGSLTSLTLNGDGGGHWTSPDGAPLPALDGCVDVDLAFSPFTNTLPIRRLALKPGAAAELAVVYVALPALEPAPDGQRYTCLAPNHYRYDSLASDFTAELPLDADGLVLDYPGLFRRVAVTPEYSPARRANP